MIQILSNWNYVNGRNKKPRHDKQVMKMKLGKYPLDKMKDNKIASLNITEDDGEYFANISLKKKVEKRNIIDLEDVVMGIDLGVKKRHIPV